MVVINGLANAEGLDQWEVLHNESGFTNADFYRDIIDGVTPALTSSGGGNSGDPAGNFFSPLPDIGGGWRESPWFGFLNPVDDSWAFHSDHGFIFVPDASTESAFYYFDLRLGWLFSNPSSYPSVYSFDRNSWIFYTLGSGNEYYDFNTEQNFLAE